MPKKFRTFTRRKTRQRSGYTVSGDKTGGECIITNSTSHTTKENEVVFEFYREKIKLEELFELNIGMLAFGGYIYTENKIDVTFELSYSFNNIKDKMKKKSTKKIDVNSWNGIGFYKEFSLDMGKNLTDVELKMKINSPINNRIQFISFDFDKINFEHFKNKEVYKFFNQKTTMHIPHIFYLETLKHFTTYLKNSVELNPGDKVVLKSCNRCSRYLPINIKNQRNKVGFSNHCISRAPCTHSNFSEYKIDNFDRLNSRDLDEEYINNENKRVISYYGHQLECRACKKFFVNAPLNPKRNSQQHREDSLRRRALEDLVDTLLEKNLIHFEFREKNQKEFSEYIWKKFNRRCFKCGKKIKLDEMQLDHTMPLSYLYRLDETATCLCSECNSSKNNDFPIDFYTESELKDLKKITGLDEDILYSRKPNEKIIRLLLDNITWFFDEFLMEKSHQKVRNGILTADKIYNSLTKILGSDIDLLEEYYKNNNKYPDSITLK